MTGLGWLLVLIIFGMPVFLAVAYFVILRWSLNEKGLTEEEKQEKARKIHKFYCPMD